MMVALMLAAGMSWRNRMQRMIPQRADMAERCSRRRKARRHCRGGEGRSVILVAVGANLPDAAGRPPALAAGPGPRRCGRLPGSGWPPCRAGTGPPRCPPRRSPTTSTAWSGWRARWSPWNCSAGSMRSRPRQGACAPPAAPPGRSISTSSTSTAWCGPLRTRCCRTRGRTSRPFVLVPLLDVAPDWVHPGLGMTAAALLAALPPAQVTPM